MMIVNRRKAMRVKAATLMGVGMVAFSSFFISRTSKEYLEANEEVAQERAAGMEGRLDSVSWQELSDLSMELSSAATDAEARALASSYGLADLDGKIDSEAVKTVRLEDGNVVGVRLVGIRSDALANGMPAGLTFAFCNPIEEAGMNDSCTNDGGWRDSDMRSWLNNGALELLPSELSSKIQIVRKRTLMPDDEVEETEDALWLFSETELCGVKEGSASDGSLRFSEREGAPYQLCLQSLESQGAKVDAFVKTQADSGAWVYWWERTADPEKGTFRFRWYSGSTTVAIGCEPNFELGACPGFCI